MKKYRADVAIVAAGPSGLAAAVTAAEAGMDVLVLEKNPVAGGTANMGMGPFGVESRLQRERMVGLRKEEAFRLMMDYTHWRVDARKVRAYIWKSGETIDWLEDMGVRFAEPAKYFPNAYATWHLVVPEGGGKPGPRGAGAMNKVLYERASEMGVRFLFSTPVTSLLVESGKAVGVRATDMIKEEEVEVSADAIIVATGGFGDNPKMIMEQCGYTYGKDIFNYRIPGIAGDGMRMVWDIGGAKGDIQMERIISTEIPKTSMTDTFRQPTALYVNLQGERVMDESVVENAAITSNIIDRQSNRRLYSIIDNKIVAYYRKRGVDYPSNVRTEDPTEGFEEAMGAAIAEYPNCAFCADTPEELAEKIGIPPEALCATFDEYNDACRRNVDDLFCKDQRYLRPITGKLYALSMCIGAYGSLGGILVNYKFEVLNGEHKPITGLYASGTDTCDIYADTYLFTLPGNTMGYAVNSGRLAAESAIEFLSTIDR